MPEAAFWEKDKPVAVDAFWEKDKPVPGPAHDEEADLAAEAPTPPTPASAPDVPTMAAATRSVLGVVDRAINATNFALANKPEYHEPGSYEEQLADNPLPAEEAIAQAPDTPEGQRLVAQKQIQEGLREATLAKRKATLAGVGETAARAVNVFGAINYVGHILAGFTEDLMQGRVLPTPERGAVPNLSSTSAAVTGIPDKYTPRHALTPTQQGLVEGVKGLPPIVAAGMLTSAGVPPPAAFAITMGGTTLEETQDPIAAAKSAAIGAILPGVGQASKELGGRIMAETVKRGLVSADNVVAQKAVEAGAELLGIVGFNEAMHLPDYAAMTPHERGVAIQKSLASNLAFLPMIVPTVFGHGQTATQEHLASRPPLEIAGRAMNEMVEAAQFIDPNVAATGRATAQGAPIENAPLTGRALVIAMDSLGVQERPPAQPAAKPGNVFLDVTSPLTTAAVDAAEKGTHAVQVESPAPEVLRTEKPPVGLPPVGAPHPELEKPAGTETGATPGGKPAEKLTEAETETIGTVKVGDQVIVRSQGRPFAGRVTGIEMREGRQVFKVTDATGLESLQTEYSINPRAPFLERHPEAATAFPEVTEKGPGVTPAPTPETVSSESGKVAPGDTGAAPSAPIEGIVAPIPEAAKPTYTERMTAAKTTDEGRKILGEHEKELVALQESIGIEPIGGRAGFGQVTKAEWKKQIAKAKKIDPDKAAELKALVEEGHKMREPWEAMLGREGGIQIALAKLQINRESLAEGKYPNGKKLKEADRKKLEEENARYSEFLKEQGVKETTFEERGAEAEAERAAVTEPESTTVIAPTHTQVREIPVDQIKLSKDVPNFKEGADEGTGTVPGQELTGKFERTGTAPIVVWERLNGDLEIITGRHRLDLARRSGETTIPGQIVKESEGFTKAMALTFDAEANIRDGQGEVSDYAHYFKHTDISEAEARARGLLSRAKGKAGWSLAKAASNDVYSLWRDGKITEAQAIAIANAAPGNEAAQRIGSKFAVQGKSADFISNVIKASEAESGTRAQSLDLFGSDDAAMVQMAEQAARASKFQSDIRKTIQAISGASKNPELARREGVDLKDPEAVAARVAELKAELARWENWPLHPDLVAKVRGEEPPPEPSTTPPAEPPPTPPEPPSGGAEPPKLRPGEKGTGDMFQGEDAPFNLSGESGIDTERVAREKEEKAKREAEAKAEQDKLQQGLIGMGGAIPSEFEHAPRATGIKNAQVDAERQSRGLPPIMRGARIGNEVVWDAAMAHIDREPGWQDRLIAELKDKPRNISPEEIVALDHRYVDLQNEYAKATRDGAQHYKDGYQDGVEEAQGRMAFTEEKLAELEQVARNVGAEWGRSGQMRQRLLKEDYTLAAIEGRMRGAQGFRPLSEEQHAEAQRLVAELEAKVRTAEELSAANADKAARAEAAQVIAEAKANRYEPRVLEAAEKFAKYMDKKGEDALARIKARLGHTSEGVDPTILADVAILGAAKLTRGIVEGTKWLDSMAHDLGEWVRQHADEIRAASEKQFASENEKFHKGVEAGTEGRVRVVPPPRRAATDIEGRIVDIKAKIKEKASATPVAGASSHGSPLYPEVRKLIKALVEDDPNIGVDGLVDAVHDILKEAVPGITRLEAMDAISGRGRFWSPDQSEVAKIVRDLSTQIRLIGHQLDVEAGKPLPRTGYQPEKLSDEARREQQKLNELKRRYGVVVTDPAAQLGSALTARKTYYTHRISDLQAEIDAREKFVKARSLSPTDPELEALKAEYAKVKAEHDEVFPRQPLTDEQRLERAIAAAERNETAAEEQLTKAERGDFTRTPPKGLPESVVLDEIRARTAALREETKALKALANPKKTPEQRALQALKARLAREKADLTERLATGDVSPRRKPPKDLKLDPATAAAKAEVVLLREKVQHMIDKAKYDAKSKLEKTWIGTKEGINLSRSILTSFDVSAPLRQGGFIAFGNPLRAAKALGPMLQAMKSERAAVEIENEIKGRDNADLYEKSGLFLAPREGSRLSGMEEAFMSRLAGRIPGIAGSQRAYTTFLNRLRADTFDALHKNLIKDGAEATPKELEAIANYINVATGRGGLGKATAASEFLATVFFSPRLVASRFQLLTGQPFYKGSTRTNYLVAKEYLKFATGVLTVLGLGVAAGGSVSFDRHSSDFMKLKFGNTRIDFLGGLSQAFVFANRFISGVKSTATGETKPIRGDVPYGAATTASLVGDFLRSKLAPVPGTILDLFTGENVVHEKVSMGTVLPHMDEEGLPSLGSAFTPLAFNDLYKVMQEQGVPAGTAIAMLSLLGAGVQNYDAKHPRRPVYKEWK